MLLTEKINGHDMVTNEQLVNVVVKTINFLIMFLKLGFLLYVFRFIYS